MKDKAKQALVVAACALACAALIAGIAARSGGQAQRAGTTPDIEHGGPDPVVDIQDPEGGRLSAVHVDISTGGTSAGDPGAGADSSGTEQTIQADPARPEAPEPPDAGRVHDGDNVPEEERNAETPPAYGQTPTVTASPEPGGGSFNGQGQMYVPGFGYIDGGGAGTVTEDGSIYENGNKVGIMD